MHEDHTPSPGAMPSMQEDHDDHDGHDHSDSPTGAPTTAEEAASNGSTPLASGAVKAALTCGMAAAAACAMWAL